MNDLKIIRVKTDRKSVCLDLSIKMKVPCMIRVVCINPKRTETYYYQRVFEASESEQMEIRLPMTPKDVDVLIYCDCGIEYIISAKVKKRGLRQYPACYKTSAEREFIKFAQYICDWLPYLSEGDYYSGGKYNFHIQVLNNIGGVDTPARVHNNYGYIQISKSKMAGNSVSMNMAILLHEYSHFYENQILEDEIEADLNGMRIYLGLNYPVLELHKAFIEVFDHADNQMNRERYDYIFKYEEKFKELKHKTCI